MYNNSFENVSSQDNPYPLLHNQQPIMVPLSSPPPLPPYIGAGEGEFPRRDERISTWSNQETRDFIEIRAQLEWDFSTSKRNKNLWEIVANRMREKGYRRTGDQCKGKWKTLVQRYKGIEASDTENGRNFPFFDEMHALFTAGANQIPPPQPDSETGTSKGKKRLNDISTDQLLEEFLEEQEDEEQTNLDDHQAPKSVEKRQKSANPEKISGQPLTDNNDNVVSDLQDILTSFIQQQQMIDMQWKEAMERRAHEKDVFEREWRETMENLERERLTLEKAWRERDEQRKLREESRAEKRDALLTILLNKLIRDENR